MDREELRMLNHVKRRHLSAVMPLGLVVLVVLVVAQGASADSRVDLSGSASTATSSFDTPSLLDMSQDHRRSSLLRTGGLRVLGGSQGLALGGGIRGAYGLLGAGGNTMFGTTSQFRLGTLSTPARETRGYSSDLLDPAPGFWEAYGGFRDHWAARNPQSLADMLRRRSSILAATSLNAPVKRASMTLGFATAPPLRSRGALGRSALLSESEIGEKREASTVPLSSQMQQRVAVMHGRARREAWAYFRNVEYVRAARLFDSATTLIPRDAESQIGEVFCYASNGSYHSAFVSMEALARRDLNPFLHRVDIASRYQDKGEADLVQTQVGAFAQSSEELRATALNAFVLWYLGKRDAAITQARLLRGGGSDFKMWASLMREAKAAMDGTLEEP